MQFLLLFVILALFVPPALRRIAAWKKQSEAERAFTMRFALFTWVIATLFALIFVRVPSIRLILLLPGFVIGTMLVKWWQNSRARLRREAETETNFDRARRIN